MKKLIVSLSIVLPILVVGAIGLDQSNGFLAGDGHARTHDFPVKATGFKVDISDPTADGARTVHVAVPVDGIDTGRSMRNFHLKMSMLNASKYPEITFDAVTKAKLTAGNTVLEGNLTINGVSNPHQIDIELSNDNGQLIASGETTIVLSEFNLPLVGMGPMKLLDHVEMTFNIEVPTE